MATKTPRKFVGSISWVEQNPYDVATIDRALLRSKDELVVDFAFEGRRYTASLMRSGGNEFHGRYITHIGAKALEGDVSCRLFTSEDGAFLFGKWFETQDWLWWAELKAVEHFPDEGSRREV